VWRIEALPVVNFEVHPSEEVKEVMPWYINLEFMGIFKPNGFMLE